MAPPRRILAFDQDDAFIKDASQHLTQAGVELCVVSDPSALAEQIAASRPDLMLVDRAGLGRTLGELTSRVRSSGIPLVLVLADFNERELVLALQNNAVEVIQRPFRQEYVALLQQLMDERAGRPLEIVTWEDQIARNFVDLARRHKMRGTLLVNRGTPFEGRVVLKDGALVRASYGPLSGMDALREILQLEDGIYELDTGLERPAQKVAVSATELEAGRAVTLLGPGDSADIRPRLLAVDDEPDMLTLVSSFLRKAGFEVETALDGEEAVHKALATPFDLIIADLNMPHMDGWGMLKTLKADHRTSEIPVIFLSAHDDYRETLRAARAGAHDYLTKVGRSEPIVYAALRTITPRLEALFHLLVNEPVEVRIQVIGLQWLLRALARLRATGALDLRDDYGSYRLEVRDGQPVSAKASVLLHTVTGVSAFARMMVATVAQGTFIPVPVPEGGNGGLTLSMEELILRACEGLNAAEAKATEQRLAMGTPYDVVPELYGLYCRVSQPKKVTFAQGICEQGSSPAELAKALKITPEHAMDWFKELFRRGVIRLRGV